jgi:hypothetical protein
MSCNPF